MKRSYHLAMILLISLFSLGGCATQYRQVAQRRVTTKETKKGEEVRVVSVDYVAFQEVIEKSPNVKSVTRMTDFQGEKEPGSFDLSPAGDELTFQALETKNGVQLVNLWKTPTTGGKGMTRLTAGTYYDTEPAYTPDGSQICFSSNRSNSTPKLFRVRTTGAGGITRITQADASDRFPDPVPNGDDLFYMSRYSGTDVWMIWKIGMDGSLPTQLKEGNWPRVSPDGSKVVYCSMDEKSRKWKIWMMNTDGTNQTQLTSGAESNDMYPSWSADGEKIVYSSNIGKDSNGKRNYDIWSMRVDGSNTTQLTTNGSTDFMPVYSPGGKYIYFLSNRGFNWDIWRMEIAN